MRSCLILLAASAFFGALVFPSRPNASPLQQWVPPEADLARAVSAVHSTLPADTLGVAEPLVLDEIRHLLPLGARCLRFLEANAETLVVCWPNRPPHAEYTEDGGLRMTLVHLRLPGQIYLGEPGDPAARHFPETGPEAAVLHGILLRWLDAPSYAPSVCPRFQLPFRPEGAFPESLDCDVWVPRQVESFLGRFDRFFLGSVPRGVSEDWVREKVRQLLATLSSPDPNMRKDALLQLGVLGRRAAISIEAVRALAKANPIGEEALTATWALGRIEGTLSESEKE
jgi:hypothetical protein